jgi:hypothetical protein
MSDKRLTGAHVDTAWGMFLSAIVAEFLVEDGEDYSIRLREPLVFIDVRMVGAPVIEVPAGFVSNGANIPAWAWPLIGAPLTGDFRRASILHDWECVQRTPRSEDVHARFYRAMRADGVGWFRVTAMYRVVRRFGPRF